MKSWMDNSTQFNMGTGTGLGMGMAVRMKPKMNAKNG